MAKKKVNEEIEELNKEQIAETAFRYLPHVNEVWVTDDGHYHLHPNKGGDKYERAVEDDEENDNENL